MYDFVLEMILMVSLGVMVYLSARALPRIESKELHESEKIHNKFDEWLSSLPLEKIDSTVASYIEKGLRKLRVFLLRIENLIDGYLNKVKEVNPGKITKETEEKNHLIGSEDGLPKE